MAFRKYSEVHRDIKAAATKFLGGGFDWGKIAGGFTGAGGGRFSNVLGNLRSRRGHVPGSRVGKMFSRLNILNPGTRTDKAKNILGNLLRRRRNV